MNENKLHIIIIFCVFLLLLTGCNKKTKIDDRKLRNLEQVNILDIKYLTLYEKISGIQLTKQRVSIKEEQTKQSSDNLSVEKKDQQENQESKSENLVETTRIIYDSNLLSDSKQPDWNASKELCYEIQNIVLDIQSQMKNNNQIETEIKFEEDINKLTNSIVNEKESESVENLSNLYQYLLKYINSNINSEKIYNVKEIYYDSIITLIFLEDDNKEKYEMQVQKLKQDSNKVKQLIQDSNMIYLVDKINILINGIDDKYSEESKENIRLKLVMLIKSISSIDTYVQKVDNFDKL